MRPPSGLFISRSRASGFSAGTAEMSHCVRKAHSGVTRAHAWVCLLAAWHDQGSPPPVQQQNSAAGSPV